MNYREWCLPIEQNGFEFSSLCIYAHSIGYPENFLRNIERDMMVSTLFSPFTMKISTWYYQPFLTDFT